MARILVLDDDDDVRPVLVELLTRKGHAVVEARDGLVDLKALGPVDLAITDVFMPGADGLEFLMRAGREAPRMPVVMLTGDPFFRGMDVLTVGRQLGAKAVLMKPVDVAALLKAVEAALAAARA